MIDYRTPPYQHLCRLGYQKKGYTNGEIGKAWIEDFDKQTKAKAGGRYRLLIVDGHNSHYMLGFLEYAQDHKIVVLCYPSHSTHVYQGLDVVIFSTLKRAWSDERDRFERNGSQVNKLNFISNSQSGRFSCDSRSIQKPIHSSI
jgi:hypothetical protein